MTELLKKIGYTVRFYRRAHGLSQIELSEIIGLSPRNLQRLELGQVEPKISTLQTLATHFKIPLHSLLRPTTPDDLLIKDISNQKELSEFSEIVYEQAYLHSELSTLSKWLEKEKKDQHPIKNMSAFISGSTAFLSNELAKNMGIKEAKINIDDYVLFGTSAERWEAVCRAKIRHAVIKNVYQTPNGLKIFEEHHFNLNPSVEAPQSECFIKDITQTHEAQQIISQIGKLSMQTSLK